MDDILELIKIISLVATPLLVIINAWFWYDKKRTDATISELVTTVSNLSKQQIEHENKFITEQRTREIIRDEIKPIKDDTSETKTNVRTIMENFMELRTDLKVLNAVQETRKEMNNPK